MLFTENETNTRELFGVENPTPYVKDAFHEYLIQGRVTAVNPAQVGTKAAALYRLEVPPGGEVCLRLRLAAWQSEPVTPGTLGPAVRSPSPPRRGRGRIFGSASANLARQASPKDEMRGSLSPAEGERAGVRGETASERLRLPTYANVLASALATNPL